MFASSDGPLPCCDNYPICEHYLRYKRQDSTGRGVLASDPTASPATSHGASHNLVQRHLMTVELNRHEHQATDTLTAQQLALHEKDETIDEMADRLVAIAAAVSVKSTSIGSNEYSTQSSEYAPHPTRLTFTAGRDARIPVDRIDYSASTYQSTQDSGVPIRSIENTQRLELRASPYLPSSDMHGGLVIRSAQGFRSVKVEGTEDTLQYQFGGNGSVQMEDAGISSQYQTTGSMQFEVFEPVESEEASGDYEEDQLTPAKQEGYTAPKTTTKAKQTTKKSKPGASTSPVVPNPANMPGSLINALCAQRLFGFLHPCLTLTVENATTSMNEPGKPRIVLLHHFEVGLDGVEAIVDGQATIRQDADIIQDRLRPLGEGAEGRVFKVLTDAHHKRGMGQGLWLFWMVRFKQTSAEKNNKKKAKWLCIGVPRDASEHIGRLPTEEQGFPKVTFGGGKWKLHVFPHK